MLDDNLQKIQTILTDLKSFNSTEPALVVLIDDKEVTVVDKELNSFKLKWREEYKNYSRSESFNDFLSLGSIVYFKEKDESKLIVQTPQAEASLVAMDSNNGYIKAYVGGYDFEKSKFDRASSSNLLLGSSIKPFIYACAFENGINPSSVFIDGPIAFQDELLEEVWRPRNNSGTFYGQIRLRESLIQSLNLVTIKLVRYIGLKTTLDCLKKYMFTSSSMTNNLSVGLGTGSSNPLSYVENYALLINSGEFKNAILIDRVENLDGEIIYDPNNNYANEIEDFSQISFPWMSDTPFDELNMPRLKLIDSAYIQAMDPRVAYIVSDILKEALKRNASRRNLELPFENVGGKTGTTNNATSTWFSGFASNIVASVWVGKDDFSSLGENEFGSTNALPIWLDFIKLSTDHLTEKDLLVPEGLSVVRIDEQSGEISNTFNNSFLNIFLRKIFCHYWTKITLTIRIFLISYIRSGA